MAINAYGENLATNGAVGTSTNAVADKRVLGKDDFMTLLLVELQHQDPTEPMDSEKILTQTSQLASLESAENTRTALEDLASSLSTTNKFSTISAIGKIADLGSDSISYDEGDTATFEIYFPHDVQEGTVNITDAEQNVIATLPVGTNSSGVYQFQWDGLDSQGNPAPSAIYNVGVTYEDSNGGQQQTRVGAYPIESVRFEGDTTMVKVGSSYVPLSSVIEVY